MVKGSKKKPAKTRTGKAIDAALVASKKAVEASDKVLATLPQNTYVEKKALSETEIIEAFDMLGITAKLEGAKKKSLFVAIARAMKLNPILGELHVAEMGGAIVPITDYKVYVDRAERSRRLEWWDVEETGDIVLGSKWKESTYKCTLCVKRRDWPRVWHYPVRFVEAVGLKDGLPNSMWSKRPWFMTYKCAVAGLRLILKEELGDLPYVDAEVDGQESYVEHRTAEPQPVEGVKVNTEGVATVDAVTPEKLDKAQKELNATYIKAARLYNIDGSPMVDAAGRPVKKAPEGVEGVELFDPVALKKFIEDAEKAKENLAALENMNAEWTLAIANRLADIAIK
jgi:hypothetical protein